MRRFGYVVVGLLATIAVVPQQARAQDQDTATAGRLERLEQQIRVSDRLRELWQDSVTAARKAEPRLAAGRDGFSISSADGAFQVRLKGYMQSDGRYFFEDSLKPATTILTLRRVRPIFEATMYKIFDIRMMPDFGLGVTVLQDAYVEARFKPWFRVRSGKFKPPVGLERLQSASDMLFVERALTSTVLPNRDLGFQLSGDIKDGLISYAVAVLNGAPDGANIDTDTQDDKDVDGRIFLQPFKSQTGSPLAGLGIGVAGTVGNQTGNAAATGLSSYKTAGQQTFFSFRTGTVDSTTVLASGRRSRITPQAYFYSGRLGILGEYVHENHRVILNRSIGHIPVKVWQVAGSFVLSGGSASYRGVNPKQPFGNGGWGAVELAGRYGQLTVGDEAFPIFADSTKSPRQATEFAVGLNWYLNRNVKVVTDLSVTSFDGGASTGDREKERVVLSMVQLSF